MVRKVSIGVPIYNESHYIRETIDSILSQDFTDFEVIISDNASTDETGDICREYANRDNRIRYFRQDYNLGQTLNLNWVIQHSTGTYYKMVGGHDILDRRCLSRCLEEIEPRPSVLCAYPIIGAIEDDGSRVTGLEWTRIDTRTMNLNSRMNVLLWGMSGCDPIFGLFRTDALRRTRLFRNVICNDSLLVFELSLMGHIALVPEPLIYLRRHRTPETYQQYMARYRRTWYPVGRSKYFRVWLSNWRYLLEHIRSILLGPIKLEKKFVLLGSAVWALVCRRGKHMIHDLIEAAGLPRP